MADTIEQIILDVMSVAPDVDPNLARLWVRDAGRRTMEARPWSWLYKRSQFVIPAAVTNVSSGRTVTCIEGSDEVEFSGSVVTESMVGSQFRTSTSLPIYDIVGYISATKFRIFPAWGTVGVSGAGFTIFKNRLVLPLDCQELVSVIIPANNRQLWLGVPQEIIDANDSNRTRTNNIPAMLSPCDYSPVPSGSFGSAVLAIGTGPKPVASGTYAGVYDSVYTIQVTTGGVGGTAVFKYKRDEGSFVTGITSDPGGNYLNDGLLLSWPDTSTFILNDVFTVTATANVSIGAVRMEVYPYPTAQTVLPYWYISRYPDVTEPNVPLPGLLAMRGDIIREKTMEFVSAWPGTEDRYNPNSQINRRDYHAANWALMVGELDRQDKGLFPRAVLPAIRPRYVTWPFPGYGLSQNYDPDYDMMDL